MHTGVNVRPRIRTAARKEICELFENDPWISPHEVAPGKYVAQTSVWNISRRKLRIFTYTLRMSTALTEDHVRSRL